MSDAGFRVLVLRTLIFLLTRARHASCSEYAHFERELGRMLAEVSR